jgi:eukaryotic-like serine/threonine-protein kinase
VYRAFHLLLEHPVAVKLLKPAPGDALSNVARFRKEGIATCRLAHRNVVQVLDFGVSAGSVAYLVMELLEGHSLAQELERDGRLTLDRCCTIVRPICDALAEAHRVGLIHRDLKPSNVFLHRNGATEVVKIIDFGLARVVHSDEAAGPIATMTSAIAGTPAYMAPERLLDGECDERADVYAMGVIVYEMLAGRRPFEWPGAGGARPPRLSTFNALVTEPLAAMVDRALARDPRQRPSIAVFQSAFVDTFTAEPPPSQRVSRHSSQLA